MSKLTAALREKFRTPEAILDALGLDHSLLRADQENRRMTTNAKRPTRIAAQACIVAGSYLRPLLAADQKFPDLMPIFRDLTTKSFSAKKLTLALDEAFKGKIAKDAMEPVQPMMSAIEHAASPATSDESVSEPQHKAMMAAAGGHSNLGIPQKVGKEFAEADKGKQFGDGPMSDQLCAFLEGKLSPEDYAQVKTMMAGQAGDLEGYMEGGTFHPIRGSEGYEGYRASKGKRGGDEAREEGEDAEPENPGEAEVEAKERAARGDKAARDKAAKDRKAMDATVSRTAMDEALKAADEAGKKRTAEAVKLAQDSFRQEQREIAEAIEEARPKVGVLSTLAFDSAEAVRRHVLKIKEVSGHDTVHASALRTLVGMLPDAGARPAEVHGGRAEMAQDEAATKRRDDIAPGRARIQMVA